MIFSPGRARPSSFWEAASAQHTPIGQIQLMDLDYEIRLEYVFIAQRLDSAVRPSFLVDDVKLVHSFGVLLAS